MSFFGELKRRNVFRVGAAYLVSSWLLIEIADIMFPAFGFPQGALKWLVGALGLGLIPLLTAFMGTCPAYLPFGIRTGGGGPRS